MSYGFTVLVSSLMKKTLKVQKALLRVMTLPPPRKSYNKCSKISISVQIYKIVTFMAICYCSKSLQIE